MVIPVSDTSGQSYLSCVILSGILQLKHTSCIQIDGFVTVVTS